jgi:hypothetical protein
VYGAYADDIVPRLQQAEYSGMIAQAGEGGGGADKKLGHGFPGRSALSVVRSPHDTRASCCFRIYICMYYIYIYEYI